MCFYCREHVAGYVSAFQRHYKNHISKNDFNVNNIFFDCTFPRCNSRYGSFYSLKRHIIEKHPANSSGCSAAEEIFGDVPMTDPNTGDDLANQNQEQFFPESSISLDELVKIINISICRITHDVGLPYTKINDFIKLCDEIVRHVSRYLEAETMAFLGTQGIANDTEECIAFRNTFNLQNLFNQVNSFKKQTQYLNQLGVSTPKPRDILLNRRQDVRHVESLPKKVMVNETASYISISDTLKFIFRSPENRKLLSEPDQATSSTPCVTEYSSFTTGETFKNSNYFRLYPDAIRLSIYQDDVELGNAFSSKAGINKVSNFCFKIQNIPEKWNSSPRTAFPLIFCTSVDVKKHGYAKILQPLVADLKKLEQGVTVYYGSEKFMLRAVMTIFCGDTLAAHDVFGLLGPRANYFCRICQISRKEFHLMPSEEYALRSKEWYETQLAAVQDGLLTPKDCGLNASGCIFNELEYYHTSNNYCLDSMHDLAEGVVPLTIQLVLSTLYKQKDLKVTSRFINNRISTFPFGYADRCNKPSPNFTDKMLANPAQHKIKQTSAQSLLLIRAFPFLFGHVVPKDCKFMRMVGHLINVVRITTSPVVSEHLLAQLEEHVACFEECFFENFKQRINKLHHLRHYALCIRKSGSMKQYNCFQFEQTNKISKNQAGTCKNFKNICSSLGKRQCLRMVINVIDRPFRDKLTFKSGNLASRDECLSEPFLNPQQRFIFKPKSATLNGIEFRVNVVIGLKIHDNEFFPTYGIIREINVIDGKVFFLIRSCETLMYDEFLEAYEIQILQRDDYMSMEECHTHSTFAIWSPHGDPKKYVSRRVYNQDY